MILFEKFLWILFIFLLTPVIIINVTTITTVCFTIIIFAYYKLLFDQINHHINYALNSTKELTLFKRKLRIINKTKQYQLKILIQQHNQHAIQIHKINLIIRRSLAFGFVHFSIFKIISLYLLININELIIKVYLILIIFILFIFGFDTCYLFTRQIKSAHKPLKTVYSIICKNKMSLSLKLKVNRLFITN